MKCRFHFIISTNGMRVIPESGIKTQEPQKYIQKIHKQKVHFEYRTSPDSKRVKSIVSRKFKGGQKWSIGLPLGYIPAGGGG